jgi:DNA N-6-adenine-methyltransferase (Dam)
MTAGRQVVSTKKDWGTPQKYVDAVKEVFGGIIHLDPCSSPFSIVGAVVEYMLPDYDGLSLFWNFSTIYVNPPYGNDVKRGSKIIDWMRKCEEANRVFQSEVIALVPVASNTAHWKKYVYGKATGICFLYETRLRFLIDGKDEGKGAPMSCAMIYWGKNYSRFFDVFIQYGAVVNIENLHGVKIGYVNNAKSQK